MLIFGALSAFMVTAILAADPFVVLPDGTQLQGGQEGSVSYFRGIPYAEPPLGNLRWTPPKPWTNKNTSVILDATKHGHACLQFLWGDDHAFDEGSEDCLFLNVFVNLEAAKNDQPLPVGIFVHGGAFISGTSHLPIYDGVDMVEFWKGSAIMVSLNYRLNVFGFLGSEALRAQDKESGSTGNYGIQDQRLAFDWVKRNIAAFGGDPNKVTIFGQSAGAGSMSHHVTNPKSAGLFNNIILESGAFYPLMTISMSCGEETFAHLLKNTDCADVACLLTKPAIDLKRASEKYLIISSVNHCTYAPMVDGVELTSHPWVLLSEGKVHDVPMMLGSVADEGAIFTVFPHDGTDEQLHTYWKSYGYTEDEIVSLESIYVTNKTYNTDTASTYWWAAERTWTDFQMGCPPEYASQQLGAMIANGTRKSPVYFYHWEHSPRQENITRHVSEIPFVFHQNELLHHPEDLKMADIMSSYWGNFIANSNPNVGNTGGVRVPRWEAYDVKKDNVNVIRSPTDTSMVSELKKEECAFFIPYDDNYIRSALKK